MRSRVTPQELLNIATEIDADNIKLAKILISQAKGCEWFRGTGVHRCEKTVVRAIVYSVCHADLSLREGLTDMLSKGTCVLTRNNILTGPGAYEKRDSARWEVINCVKGLDTAFIDPLFKRIKRLHMGLVFFGSDLNGVDKLTNLLFAHKSIHEDWVLKFLEYNSKRRLSNTLHADRVRTGWRSWIDNLESEGFTVKRADALITHIVDNGPDSLEKVLHRMLWAALQCRHSGVDPVIVSYALSGRSVYQAAGITPPKKPYKYRRPESSYDE